MAEVNPMTGYLQDKCGACGELAGVYANGNWYCYQHSAWGRLDTAEAELAALRAENERLKARGIEGMQHRIAELKAALKRCKDAATDLRSGGFNEWEIADEIEDAAAALLEVHDDA